MADDIQIMGIDHIAMTVRDVTKAVHFYRDLVGLKVTSDYQLDQDPNRPTALYCARHARRHLVTFDTFGGPALALNAHPGDDLPGERLLLDSVGINHVSFLVSDLAALTTRMSAAGVESPAPGWFFDPDGNLVQFEEPGHSQAALQRLESQADEKGSST